MRELGGGAGWLDEADESMSFFFYVSSDGFFMAVERIS